jgi:hypothetical protein
VEARIVSRFPRIDASTRPDSALCDMTTALPLASGQSVIFALFADQHSPALDFQLIGSGVGDGYAGFVGGGQLLSNLDLTVYSSGTSAAALTGEVYIYDATQGDFGQTELLTGSNL